MVDNANYLNTVDNKNFIQVKQELEIDVNDQLTLPEVNGTELWLCQEVKKETNTTEEDIEELYAGHVVKEELVIGPEVLQQPDVAATSGIYKEAQEDTSRNFCSVLGENKNESAPPTVQELRVRVSAVRRTYGNRRKGAHRQYSTLPPAEVKDAENEKRTKFDTEIVHDANRERECDKEYKVAVIKTENNQSVETEIKGNKSGNVESNNRYLNPFQDLCITKSLDFVEDNTMNGELNKDTHSSHNNCKYQTVTDETLNKELSPQDTSRQFVCDSCGLTLNPKQSLVKHINLCESEAKCALKIRKSKCLHKHYIKAHHKVNSKAKHEVGNNSYIKERFSVHKGEKLYSCAHCKYSTSRKSDLTVHLKEHTSEKPYSCTYCEYRCTTTFGLKIHLRKHTGEKPYSCSYCEYSCSTKSYLKIHLRKHTGEKPFTCTYCEYSCSHNADLKVHIRKHTGEKPYTCTYCKHSFRKNGVLKVHLRKHTGEKPYTCTYCKYRFSRNSDLRVHLRKHTGEKPYTCTYCNYSCSTSGYLKIHLGNHTGEKLYTCTYCTYSCNQRCNLKDHLRQHTGEKPYCCTYCAYRCSRSSYLKVHLQKHAIDLPYPGQHEFTSAVTEVN